MLTENQYQLISEPFHTFICDLFINVFQPIDQEIFALEVEACNFAFNVLNPGICKYIKQ